MVNNATDLELKEHNDNAQFASELNSKQEPVNQNSANALTAVQHRKSRLLK